MVIPWYYFFWELRVVLYRNFTKGNIILRFYHPYNILFWFFSFALMEMFRFPFLRWNNYIILIIKNVLKFSVRVFVAIENVSFIYSLG